MALDARHRSSIYMKFVPLLGEDDTNALMSEFPSVEADELVTKDHLRAEVAELRSDLDAGLASLRSDMDRGFAAIRVEMADGFRRQQTFLLGAIAAATAVLGTLTAAF